MRGHSGSSPDIAHLLDEVQLLHERLHRVTVALAITEELVADTFDRMAEKPSANATEQRLASKRARSAAAECRMFAARLAAPNPPGEPPSPPPHIRLV